MKAGLAQKGQTDNQKCERDPCAGIAYYTRASLRLCEHGSQFESSRETKYERIARVVFEGTVAPRRGQQFAGCRL